MPALPALHWELTGNASGPAVVFLHGFMGNTKDWDPVIDRMANRCLCLAIDLPGHGKSTGLKDKDAYTFVGAACRVVEVIEKIGTAPATVAGYSMGGRLALYVACHYTRVCCKLVVESAAAGISEDKERRHRRTVDEVWADRLEKRRFEDFLRTWYRQPVFYPLAENPEKFENMIQHRLINDPGELALAMRGLGAGAQPSLWHALPKLTLPVLLLAGEHDKKYVDIHQSMMRLLPRGRPTIVAGAGHNVHLDAPSVVADHIKDFVFKESI
jgi:2-succinyl-6-hydroxy-2,4-cyclohexadiene-1-carboxylate synthase